MVFCDEAPPHAGSLRQKVLWEREREKKSVCLFSSSIVMLIIRNWRRCILVRVEFQVFFPPLSPFIISSLKMLKRRYVSWRCEVNTLYNYWILMTTFSFLFVNCLWEENINSPTPYYIRRFVILILCVQTPNTPPVACAVLMALRGPLLHWCLMELIVPYQFSHHFPWNWTLVPMYHPAAPFLGSDWSMERKL